VAAMLKSRSGVHAKAAPAGAWETSAPKETLMISTLARFFVHRLLVTATFLEIPAHGRPNLLCMASRQIGVIFGKALYIFRGV